MNTRDDLAGDILRELHKYQMEDTDRAIWKAKQADAYAADAMFAASDETVQAVAVIAALPQLMEADVLVILHALQRRIEGSGNMHCEHWKELCDDLAWQQLMFLDIEREGGE
jgi:hypothetical protein